MLRSKKTFWSSNFFYLSSYYGLVAEPRWWLVLRLSQSNQFRLDLTGTELAKSYTFLNEFMKLLILKSGVFQQGWAYPPCGWFFIETKKFFFRFIFLKIGLDRKCWIRLILYKSGIYVFVYVFPYSASSVKRNFEYSTLTKSAVCIQMYSCTNLRLLLDVKGAWIVM